MAESNEYSYRTAPINVPKIPLKEKALYYMRKSKPFCMPIVRLLKIIFFIPFEAFVALCYFTEPLQKLFLFFFGYLLFGDVNHFVVFEDRVYFDEYRRKKSAKRRRAPYVIKIVDFHSRYWKYLED